MFRKLNKPKSTALVCTEWQAQEKSLSNSNNSSKSDRKPQKDMREFIESKNRPVDDEPNIDEFSFDSSNLSSEKGLSERNSRTISSDDSNGETFDKNLEG